MDKPVLVGLIVIAVAYLIGATAEKWSWAKPVAVACFIALALASLVNAPL